MNCSVQSFWNLLENVLITATDIVAPLVELNNNKPLKKSFIPPNIVSKINKCKRLLKINRLRFSSSNSRTIKALSVQIKKYFTDSKISRVRAVALGDHRLFIYLKQAQISMEKKEGIVILKEIKIKNWHEFA